MDKRAVAWKTSVGAGAVAVVLAVVAAGFGLADRGPASAGVGWLALGAATAAWLAWIATRTADQRRQAAATAHLLRRLDDVRTRSEAIPIVRQLQVDAERQSELLEGILGRLETDRASLDQLAARLPRASQRIGLGAIDDETRLEASAAIASRIEERLGRSIPLRPAAVDPELAIGVVEKVLDASGPELIMVVGDGHLAVALGLASRRARRAGRIIAIEHHAPTTDRLLEVIADLELDDLIEVRRAPLVRHHVGDRSVIWYGDDALADELDQSDLVIVVGPTGPYSGPDDARCAVPPLATLLRSARVVLDVGTASDTSDVRNDLGSTASVRSANGMRSRQIDSSELADGVWSERYGRTASYMHKLHESKRRSSILQLLGHRQRVWAYNDKLAGYRLAQDVGIATPEIYARSTTLDEIDWSALPQRFVVKPHDGANNRGVFLLVARGGDEYRDLMDDRVKTLDQVRATYADLADAKRITKRFAVEELLAPGADLADRIDVPDDLKVYCFYDRPVLAMQRRMNGTSDRKKWTFKFWSVDGDDLGPVKYADRCDPMLEMPHGLPAVFDAAAAMGRRLATPFCRLDFFDTSRGAVFGELAPHPGPPEVWDDETDEMLGKEWEIAEARLLVEQVGLVERRPR